MEKNSVSPKYKGLYYALPQIDKSMSDSEWRMFTCLFNHIMTVTKHGTFDTSVEITHEWLSDKIGKSVKQSQRLVCSLEELGVIRVNRANQKANRYEVDWNVINELARRQAEGKDIDVALAEDKSVSYAEDKNVSHTEDMDVSHIRNRINKRINKERKYNKKKENNGKPITAGQYQCFATNPNERNPNDFSSLSSSLDEDGWLANARNDRVWSQLGVPPPPSASLSTTSFRHLQQSQYKSIGITPTAAHSHSPIEGNWNTPQEQSDLQSSVAGAAPHPLVPLTPPLSPREKTVMRYCEKYYDKAANYTIGELDKANECLNNVSSMYFNPL